MGEKAVVYSVDDDSVNQEIIQEFLGGAYEVVVCLRADECINLLKWAPPDVILMDIDMPGMNGYEACKKLREHEPSLESVPILFVSAHKNLEERLKAYEVGGMGFLPKPFDRKELLAKVQVALEVRKEQIRLLESADEAQKITMEALTTASEYGVVIRFLQDTYRCKTLDDLAEAFLSVTSSFGLNSSLQFRWNGETFNYSSEGLVKPIESDLLELARLKGRIFDFKNRTVFNYRYASLLVKNMPLDSPESYGRYKDSIVVLVEGANERVHSLSMEQEIAEQRDSWKQVAALTKHAMQDIEERHRSHKIETAAIIDDLYMDLDRAFMRLDLTEEQEQVLLATVKKRIEMSQALYSEGLEIETNFSQIMRLLDGQKRASTL